MVSPSNLVYRFERLNAGHYPLLQKLFLRVYKIQLSLQDLEKRFDTSVLKKNVVGFIAIHKETNEPAAYYGVFPMYILVENKKVFIGQSGDLMTDPLHRNKNLFVQLAELTHGVCKEEGMKMVISQPNASSVHGFKNKLGFKTTDEIIRWDLKQKFKTFPLSKLAHRFPSFKKGYLKYARHVLKKHIEAAPSIYNNPLNNSMGKVIRDDAYISYKDSTDRFFIKIENLILWVRLTDVFWIGDFDNYEALDSNTIKKLRKLAFKLGYNTISFNMNESVQLPDTLSEFKKYSSQPSCILYLDESFSDVNIILAAADSDTW